MIKENSERPPRGTGFVFTAPSSKEQPIGIRGSVDPKVISKTVITSVQPEKMPWGYGDHDGPCS